MNVALFLDGDCYNNDAIFDDSPDNWLNHDKLLHVWLNMKKYLNDRGVNIHTYDKYPRLDAIDKAVFHGLYTPNDEYLKQLSALNIDCYYVAYEPPVIHHYNMKENLYSIADRFKKILTYQDDLIDNKKFFRLVEGKVLPDMTGHKDIPFSERFLMLMMNSYRYANSDSYRELYSERFRASQFFEGISDEFHVYGRGINNPERIKKRWGHKRPIFFNSYAGEVENKMAVMCRYKFNLCFENCAGVYGYISEKIIHSFLAGVVPVYWGPINPTDYFPAETFIDARRFGDYRELHEHLVGVDEKRFNKYFEAISDYLKSDRYQRLFGKEVFGRAIYNMLTEETEYLNQHNESEKEKNRGIQFPQNKPRVSILIPTRNRSQLLSQNLECLSRQEYPNLEIVIVDDCSEDETPSVVERFKESLPHMIYSKNETQTGAAIGFLKAAELATGDYLLNSSDDDLLEDGALDEFIQPLEKNDYDMIYSDLKIIDEDNNQTSVWRYDSYPEPIKLLRKLMDSGANVIPEVLLIKKEIYSKVYGELYSKRFITPFYLSSLPYLKMFHIAKPLYKYRIHKKSTFSDTSGLIVRNKGVLNFMNLIMFNYAASDIFETGAALNLNEKIVLSIVQFILRLLGHAQGFFEGEFYTGAKYTEKDFLWGIFYEYASYWLRLGRRYGIFQRQLDDLERKISDHFSCDNYDKVEINKLPTVYYDLPWFSYMPINEVTEFIAFDMVTMGKNSLLNQNTYDIFVEGDIQIKASNKIVGDLEALKSYLNRHPIQVINIFDSTHFENVLEWLEAQKRFFVCIVNATGKELPPETVFKNSVTFDHKIVRDFKTYLDILNSPVGRHYRSDKAGSVINPITA